MSFCNPIHSVLLITLLFPAFSGCDQGNSSGSAGGSPTDALKEKGVTFSKDLKNNIQAVRFATHKPSDDEFLHLAGFAALKEIHAEVPDVTDHGIAVLGTLPKLQIVSLSRATLTASTLSAIAALANLQQLDLPYAKGIDDASVAALKSHPTLEALDLGYTSITDDSLDTILSIPKLKSIRVVGTKFTDKGLARLANTAALEQIAVGSETITDEGVKLLASSVGLIQLEIIGSKVTDDAMSALSALPKLQTLCLMDNLSLTDSGICKLGTLPSLTNICVAGTAFTGAGMGKAGFPALLGLDANRSKVTDSNMSEFSEVKNLTSLKVKGTSATEAGVRAVFPPNDPTAVAFGPFEN